MDTSTLLLLPTESKSRAELSNRILSQLSKATTTACDQTGKWSIRIANPNRIESQRYWIKLESEEHSVYLGTHTSSLTTPLGDRVWSDYPESDHPIAWTLSNRILLDHLYVLTGLEWQATSFRQAVEMNKLTQYRPQIQLLWQFQLYESGAAGSLIVSSATMENWLKRISDNQLAGFENQFDCPNPWVRSLPLRWGIYLPPILFSTNELSEFAPGDIILHGNYKDAFENLLLQYSGFSAGFHCRLSKNAIEIVKPTGKAFMTNQVDSPSFFPSNQIPIQLEFKLSELSLTLEELNGLSAGHIFELSTSLENATTDIYANGKKIGVGQLIAVEEHLGVRIIGFESNGV